MAGICTCRQYKEESYNPQWEINGWNDYGVFGQFLPEIYRSYFEIEKGSITNKGMHI